MTGLEVAFYVTSIGSLIGIGAVARWIVRRISRANRADTEAATRRAVDAAITPLIAKVDGLDARTGRIERQFYNNGGSSLRDRVDQAATSAQQAVTISTETKTRLEDHLDQSRDDRARITAIEQTLRTGR